MPAFKFPLSRDMCSQYVLWGRIRSRKSESNLFILFFESDVLVCGGVRYVVSCTMKLYNGRCFCLDCVCTFGLVDNVVFVICSQYCII